MKRLALASVVLLGAVLNAHADTQTYFFKDVVRPQGQERSSEQRRDDGVACGGTYDRDIPADSIPAFKKCMLSRGWRFDHIVTTRTPAAHQAGVYTYYDTSKRGRGDGEEQAATLACDGGDTTRIQTAAFKACMRTQGWRLASFQPYAPDSADDEQDKRNEDASNDAERRADDQRQNDQWIEDRKNSQQQQ